MVHHGIFRRVPYANGGVRRVNLLRLMAVAFLPFPTKLVAEAIRDTSAERAAVIFYGGSLMVISPLFSALWATVASDRRLLKPQVSEKQFNAIAHATTPNLSCYVAVIALASSPQEWPPSTAGHPQHPRPPDGPEETKARVERFPGLGGRALPSSRLSLRGSPHDGGGFGPMRAGTLATSILGIRQIGRCGAAQALWRALGHTQEDFI